MAHSFLVLSFSLVKFNLQLIRSLVVGEMVGIRLVGWLGETVFIYEITAAQNGLLWFWFDEPFFLGCFPFSLVKSGCQIIRTLKVVEILGDL